MYVTEPRFMEIDNNDGITSHLSTAIKTYDKAKKALLRIVWQTEQPSKKQ